MPALGFKRRFVPGIVAKTKQHSIRRDSSIRFPRGCTLYLFTGLRTKHCKRFGTATVESVRRIEIDLGGEVFWPHEREQIDDDVSLNAFAVSDGFRDWEDLRRFWHKHHRGVQEFAGRQIIWGETFQPAASA